MDKTYWSIAIARSAAGGGAVKIRLIEIENFRGIARFSWCPSEGVNCLVGPGDCGKTTILDAIELSLAPRYQIVFDDADFFGAQPDVAPISITVTVGDLPKEFLTAKKYAEYTRGWDTASKTLVDEPDEGAGLEYVLSIRLSVDKSLEPKWRLHTDRYANDSRQDRTLAYQDRAQVSPSRLGIYADRHLTWGRQSILSRLTEAKEPSRNVLLDATRAARSHFSEAGSPLFLRTVETAAALAGEVGVPLENDVSARLDVQSVTIGASGVSLHQADIPLRLLGTGSSRLLVAAMQNRAGDASPVSLIDELEYGLEPHRISRLLRYLCANQGSASPQLFLTTHSPIVVQELPAADMVLVRRNRETGDTRVLSPTKDALGVQAQKQLRTTPYAYLAPSVLVCEGKTEMGVLRGLDDYWCASGGTPYATLGVATCDGRGKDQAPDVAMHFRSLQYRVALFLDSDKDPDDPTILDYLGLLDVQVVRWEKGKATEDVLFCDLSDDAVRAMVDLLHNEHELKGIPDQVRSLCGQSAVRDWHDLKNRCTEATMRAHLARCAKEFEWLKPRIDLTHAIGRSVLGPELSKLTLENAQCVTVLRKWIEWSGKLT